MIELLQEWGLSHGLSATLETTAVLVLIAIVAIVAWLFLRLAASRVAFTVLERERRAEASVLPQIELERRVRTLERITVRTAAGIIAVIAVLTALSQLGIDIGPAVAGLGVAGIAVGLGAQTFVRDWLAGIFILVENQYSQGDVVRIAGVSGMVEDFSLRRTTLRDLDGTVHTVPNGQISVASNMTRVWARVNLDVPVAYQTDIDHATKLINETGESLLADPSWGERLLEAPTVVRVGTLGDTGVTLKVLGQVRAAEQWAVAGELRKRILAAFARNGIRMPTTQRIVVSSADAAPVEAPAAANPGAPLGDASVKGE